MTHCAGHTDAAISRWQRVRGWSERDTKRGRGGGTETNGERGWEKRMILGVYHLHTLDIGIWDKRRGCVLKVKNKMNAFVAGPIVCGQSCVILLLSAQSGMEKKKSKAATQRKLNPTEKYYFEMW